MYYKFENATDCNPHINVRIAPIHSLDWMNHWNCCWWMSWTLELCVREVCVCVECAACRGTYARFMLYVCVCCWCSYVGCSCSVSRVFVCMRMLCYSSRGWQTDLLEESNSRIAHKQTKSHCTHCVLCVYIFFSVLEMAAGSMKLR